MTNLKRSIGLGHATAMVVGIIIGASIFVQPAEIMRLVPSVTGVFLVWAASGMLTFFGALACAELASAFPRTGGVYIFLKETYSPSVGFYDNLSVLLAGASNEVTNTGYARKTLTDADLTPSVVDDTNDYVTLTFPTQTFATISAGNAWRKLLVCYDSDTTGGTDANIVPMYGIDLLIDGAAVVPSGANVVISLASGYAIVR